MFRRSLIVASQRAGDNAADAESARSILDSASIDGPGFAGLNEIGRDLGGGAGKLPHAAVRTQTSVDLLIVVATKIDRVEAAALAQPGCEPVTIPQQAQSGAC